MSPPVSNSATPIHPSSPHGNARQIRRNVLLLLGFYNVSLHAGIARYASEACWSINNQYAQVGHPPIWWRGDGILSIITSPKDVRALENFPPLPLVDMSQGWTADSMPAEDRQSGIGRPRVYYDNEKIGQVAAEHFLQRGFKHLAYLNIGNYWLEQQRIPAFRQAIQDAGGTFHEIEYYQQLSEPHSQLMVDHLAAHEWLTRTLAGLPKPLGIAACSDDTAVRLLQACSDAGLAVPEEVGVLGCDNDLLTCNNTPVPLSSVDNDWERIGYEAARLLDQLMDGATAPLAPVLIPPKGVVTRLSTNILAVPDPKIARALRFIWENFPQPIGTCQVADAAGLNRRKLERGFSFHLGRSVGDEIMRVRIDHAKHLLLETRKKTQQIAEEIGFSGATSFSNAFVRITGTRPSNYRRGTSPRA